MHRIDNRTVRLDTSEVVLTALFEQHLDEGLGIQEAATLVFMAALAENWYLDPAFVAHLSDNTLRLSNGFVLLAVTCAHGQPLRSAVPVVAAPIAL